MMLVENREKEKVETQEGPQPPSSQVVSGAHGFTSARVSPPTLDSDWTPLSGSHW